MLSPMYNKDRRCNIKEENLDFPRHNWEYRRELRLYVCYVCLGQYYGRRAGPVVSEKDFYEIYPKGQISSDKLDKIYFLKNNLGL